MRRFGEKQRGLALGVVGGFALGGLGLAACGGPEAMSGFVERDATAVAAVTRVDACAPRTGRLVVEPRNALVREYPNTELARLKRAKQPLLLVWLRGERQAGRPPEVDLSMLAAPEDYVAGDRIRFFDGRRLFERPLRALAGQRLELRLAENDRTLAPRWVATFHTVAGAGLGAASAAGAVVPPEGAVGALVELLRKLDRDDLVLRWAADVDALVAQLGAHGALTVHLASPRAIAAGPGRGLPAAELDLLIYVEPEPGCP